MENSPAEVFASMMGAHGRSESTILKAAFFVDAMGWQLLAEVIGPEFICKSLQWPAKQ